jgi:transcriptional antiterminator RfaH
MNTTIPISEPRTYTQDREWFVCQTNVREEDRARYYLEQKGFPVYLPMMEMERFVGFRNRLIRKPLFSNYLFVRFHEESEGPYVCWTRGVRKILPESSRPTAVDDQIVESIRLLAQKDGIIRKQALRKRDRVRILGGPFKDVMGIFEEWASDAGRVRVLLRFVEYQAKLELHQSLVEKVS